MNSFDATTAASILVAHRIAGTHLNRLPETCRPIDIDQALAIQNAVTKQWCELQDDSIGAWKCGTPPLNKVVVAPIYTRTIDSVAPAMLWPKENLARVEPELAFFFGQDLPARTKPYTVAEVDAAISRTHLALELINTRYATPQDCEFPEMLADGLVNQGLFIGPQINNDLAKNAGEIAITVTYAGKTITHHGKHPNNNPRLPLYWLAEFLRQQGQGIVAGQAVITGSYAGVVEVPLATDITFDYTGLGQLQVNFTARNSEPLCG